MEKFNVTGFIQPAFVYEILNLVPDANGLNDRQMFNFSPEREPMPLDTADLFATFLVV